MLNYTLTNNNFNQISPIEPIILDFYAYFLIIIFLLCVCCNSFLLISQSRYKELYSPSLNYLIIAITASNLFGSIQFPALIYSNFIRKWAFSKLFCHLIGWLMYFVGCMQVFLMAAICYETNFNITTPLGIEVIANIRAGLFLNDASEITVNILSLYNNSLLPLSGDGQSHDSDIGSDSNYLTTTNMLVGTNTTSTIAYIASRAIALTRNLTVRTKGYYDYSIL